MHDRPAGDYIGLPSGEGEVHWRPDPRLPLAACGKNFAGTFATTHPIVAGLAFSCGRCQKAYDHETEA